ncbi:hypothetical protein QTP88_027109 [Uroleucon formosanum]
MESAFLKSGDFEVKSGLRQGDALSSILFNIVLERVVRDMHETREMDLNGKGTLLAYADDIVILGDSQNEVEASINKLIKSSKRMGLIINESKIKYMIMSRRSRILQNLAVGEYTFEQVEDFKYLGVNLNNKNDMHNEIRLRLNAANRGYYAMSKMFSSKLLSKETKMKLYISYLRPIVMYGCETWSTTKGDETKLLTFERKVLRKVYGPIYNTETGQYEKRTNADIERIFNGPNIQKYLVSKRLEWAGHIWRDKGSVMRQVLVSKLYKTRPRGRPRQRWLDRVKKDLIQVDETTRIEDADNRDRWQDGLPAIIKFDNEHNHSICTAEALFFLRPTTNNNVKKQFEDYFYNGLGIAESSSMHESKIELEFGPNCEQLANDSINPKYRTVRFWYDQWKQIHLGPASGVGVIQVD